MEAGHIVVIKTVSNTAAVMTESEWSAVASLQDEARMLFHNLVNTISNKIDKSAAKSQYRNTTTSDHPIQTIGESTSFPSNTGIFQLEGTITHTKYQTKQVLFFSSTSLLQQDKVVEIFMEAMGSDYWKDVKCMFKAHLRMEDTGS